jgi:aspartyl-tRNA(Asn)/glutamyl-tRNA(Gln) amidotransferase subunit C
MNTEEITRLAHLARLSVPEAELDAVGRDIGAILGFVDTIQSVQLEGGANQGTGQVNAFREDAVAPLVADHDLIEAAPLHQDHFVKVPKVLE